MAENRVFAVVNTDGSADLTVDGKKVRFVRLSDLGAVKTALKDKEDEVTKLQSDLAAATSKFDESHQEALKERAAREQFEQKANQGAELQTKLTDLEAKLADHEKVSGELTNKLTERLKAQLTGQYKIAAEKLSEKSLSDLENIESTLQLTGVVAQPANYDGKTGVTEPQSLQGKSPISLATQYYEENKAKQ